MEHQLGWVSGPDDSYQRLVIPSYAHPWSSNASQLALASTLLMLCRFAGSRGAGSAECTCRTNQLQ